MSNVTIPATGTGTATPVIATDTVAGIEYQRVKLDVGGVGVSTPVTAAAPLPVVQTGTPGLPTGAATEATLDARTGALTETAPATDTASSGINGRLQRIAQRLTSLIAVFNIGAGTEAAAVRVTLPTDGTGKVGLNAGTANIGDVDVLTVPADPFGANADAVVAAGATGSIQAKLRRATQGLEDLKTLIVLGAGTNNIGDVDVLTLPVVNPIVRISQTPTVSTSPAYTAKDAVGGLLTFANAARVSAGSGKVQSVTIVDLSQQMPALDLVLFNQTFTNSTDNAVFDPTDGDLANVVGVIPVSNWADFNDNSVATRGDLNLPFTLTGTSLFGQLVTRSTPTFVGTSDIIVLLGIEQA